MLAKAALLNPWVIGGVAALLAASHGYVGLKAYKAGQDKVVAETSRLIDNEVRVRDAAIAGASEAIAKLEVRNVTIRQQAETVVREVPVYRECRHDPLGLQLTNAALVPGEPAPGGKLP